jgi:hypothetical protein
MSLQNPLSFLSGFVQDRNIIRVIAQVDQLKEAGSTASRLMKWVRSENHWLSFRLDWQATRLCVLYKPEIQVLAMGPTGLVAAATQAGDAEEQVDTTGDGPRRRGDLRDLRRIGDTAYVAGMSRQVYRRDKPNQWTRQDSGVVNARGTLTVAGFNSIHGVSEHDIVAVGFSGEIWRRQNSSWRQLVSPTNLVLHRVLMVREDLAYACGQEGILLQGTADNWQVLAQNTVREDIWGLEWFNEQLYVACDRGVFVLGDDDDLHQVDFGLGFGLCSFLPPRVTRAPRR